MKTISNQANILCVGINHKQNPLPLREKCYLTSKEIPPQLKRLAAKFSLQEIVILSTCNRCEIYAVSRQNTSEREIFLTLHNHLTHEEVRDIDLYVYKNTAAVRHILTVTSSIDSLVVGETQITRQCKEAFSLAKQAHT